MIKISALAFAAVEQFHLAAVEVHAEDLIALIGWAGGLEDDFRAVIRKIRFGVLTAEGKLPQVLQAGFLSPC
jgi:hypothetical protein